MSVQTSPVHKELSVKIIQEVTHAVVLAVLATNWPSIALPLALER